MTEPKDPARLLDAGEPGLRELMRSAERDVGSDQQVARLAARLGVLLAPPAAIAAGSSQVSGAAGVGTAVKVGGGALAVLVAGGAWWLFASQPAQLSSSPAAPVEAPAVVAAPPAAPAPIVAPPSAVAPAPSAAEVPPVLPSKPAPPAVLSEAEILEQARSALKSDPARALSRANQHASRYPGGALVQEREVIAIKALRALGRNAEADRRAEAFAKAYPGSAFGRKLKPTP